MIFFLRKSKINLQSLSLNFNGLFFCLFILFFSFSVEGQVDKPCDIKPDSKLVTEGNEGLLCCGNPCENINIDLDAFFDSNEPMPNDVLFSGVGGANEEIKVSMLEGGYDYDPSASAPSDSDWLGVFSAFAQSGIFQNGDCDCSIGDDDFSENQPCCLLNRQDLIDKLLEEAAENDALIAELTKEGLTIGDFTTAVESTIDGLDVNFVKDYLNLDHEQYNFCDNSGGSPEAGPEDKSEGDEVNILSLKLGSMGMNHNPKGEMNPSPSSLNFVNQVNAGVNLYNGSQSSNINLYNFSSNDISVPIGLNSNSNGLKVNEIGGVAGLNWSLNAGSRIARVVKGAPDEFESWETKGYGWGLQKELAPNFSLSTTGASFFFPGSDELCSNPAMISEENLKNGFKFKKKIGNVILVGSWTPVQPTEFVVTTKIKIPLFPALADKFAISIDVGASMKLELNDKPAKAQFTQTSKGFMYAFDDNQFNDIVGGGGLPSNDMQNIKNIFDTKHPQWFRTDFDNDFLKDPERKYFSDLRSKFSDWKSALQTLWNGTQLVEYGKEIVDTEPDEFYYSVPGYSGKFYFAWNATNESFEIVTFPATEGLEIVYEMGSEYIVGFTIITPDGMEYIYSSPELTENIDYYLPNSYSFPELELVNYFGTYDRTTFLKAELALQTRVKHPVLGRKQLKSNPATWERNFLVTNKPKFSSAWHLVEIKSSMSEETVQFEYEELPPMKYFSNKSYSYTFPNFGFNNGSLKTASPPLYNPQHIFPSRWQGGVAEFAYSATESITTGFRLKKIGPGRGEFVKFAYEKEDMVVIEDDPLNDRGGMLGDKLLSEVQVYRNNVFYKGWKLRYENVDNEIAVDCTGPTLLPELEYQAPNEVVFELGAVSNLSKYEKRYIKSFHLGVGIGSCKAKYFNIPYLRKFGKIETYPHYSEMSEFGSIMTVKSRLKDMNFIEITAEDWLKDVAIFEEEGKRSFIMKIEGIDTETKTFDFLTFDYINVGQLPKRYSLKQDGFGYYSENPSKSPFPKVAYQGIVNGPVSIDDNAYNLFGFNVDGGEIWKGQADPVGTQAEVGSLSSLLFASGASKTWQYESNVLPDGSNGAGVRVESFKEDPNGAAQKIIKYSYKSPTVVNWPSRILDVTGMPNYYRATNYILGSYSFEEKFERKVRLSSSPLNNIYENGSNLVGYGRVIEMILGNGRIEHEFLVPEMLNGIICQEIVPSSQTEDEGNCAGSSVNRDFLNLRYNNSEGRFALPIAPSTVNPELDISVIGMWNWSLGKELATHVFKEDGVLRQHSKYYYENKFFANRPAYWSNKSISSIYYHRATWGENFVLGGSLLTKAPWTFNSGKSGEIFSALVSLIINVLIEESDNPHPFKRVERNLAMSDLTVCTGLSRLTKTEVTDYFGDGSESITAISDYVYGEDGYAMVHQIPTKVTTTFKKNETFALPGKIEKINLLYSVWKDNTSLYQGWDQGIWDEMTKKNNINYRHYFLPHGQITKVNTNMIACDYSTLAKKLNDNRLVPSKRYGFVGNSIHWVGEFEYNSNEEMPSKYKMSTFSGMGEFYPEPIILTWNNQLQLKSRSYGDFGKTYIYNDFFELKEQTNEDGISTSYEYDTRRRLWKKTALGGGQITDYSYTVEPDNNTVTSLLSFPNDSDIPSQETKQFFSGFGSPLKVSRENDGVILSSVAYDIFSRKISEYMISTGATTYKHEKSPISRLTIITDAVGNITEQEDLVSNYEDYPTMTRTFGPNDSELWNHFDVFGNRVVSESKLNDTEIAKTHYSYDGHNRLEEIKNPINEVYSYSYNGMGKVVEMSVPGGGTKDLWYDDYYNLVGTRDSKGNEFVHAYDKYSRLENTYKTDGILEDDQEHIVDEHPCGDCPEVVLTNVYKSGQTWLDAQTERILDPGNPDNFIKVVDFTFDNYGRMTGLDENILFGADSKAVSKSFSINDASLITSSTLAFTDEFDFNFEFEFDDVLRPTTTKINDQLVNKYTYNSRDFVKVNQLGQVDGNQFLQDVDFGYDAAGKLLRINSPFTTDCFSGEICKLSSVFTLGKANNIVTAIQINGEDFAVSPELNLSPSNAATTLESLIQEAISYYGFFGDVNVSTQWVVLFGSSSVLQYTITVENTNIETLFLLNGTISTAKFEPSDCCSPDMTEDCPSEVEGYTLLGEYEGHSYYLSNTASNWQSAVDASEYAGGYLTSISSEEENDYIIGLISSLKNKFYIGYNDIAIEGQGAWVNGEPVTFDNSIDQNSSGNDFGAITSWGQDWEMQSVWGNLQHILEMDCTSSSGGNVTTDCSNPIEGFSELGEFNGHKYFISDAPLNWNAAKTFSESAGGYLVTMNDQAENEFIKSNLNDNMVFIGYNDATTEGVGQWANGDPVTLDLSYENSSENDFAVMNHWQGTWEMVNQWVAKRFVMEVDCGSNGNISQVEIGVDLFSEVINYNQLNIDKITYGGDCNFGMVQNKFTYDFNHRLTSMNNVIFNPGRTDDAYSTEYTYDLAGNILTLNRNGHTAVDEFNQIDQLGYTYSGSRLDKVEDNTANSVHREFGFPFASSSFAYDTNGNRTTSSGNTITYNEIDLPERIIADGGSMGINYSYQGQKLRKTIDDNPDLTRIYFSGMEYLNGKPESYHFADGRIIFKKDNEKLEVDYFEYKIADHLGNLVVTFREENDAISVFQRHFYYPFGMNFDGVMPLNTNTENRFQYNGKELEKDFGINLSDYGARWYDASIARFTSVDPLAEQYSFQSPYAYAVNNPVLFRDIMGMGVDTDYYNTKGKLLLHTNDGLDNIVIVREDKSSAFYSHVLLSQGLEDFSMDSKEFNSRLTQDVGKGGIAYDKQSIEALYERSRKHVLDPKRTNVKSPVFAEHGNVGLLKDGIVRIKAEGDLAPGYPNMTYTSSEGVNYAHAHPNEALGPFKYLYDNGRWGTNNPNNTRGPSPVDYRSVIAKDGLYDIMVDDKSIYFFTRNKEQTISISK